MYNGNATDLKNKLLERKESCRGKNTEEQKAIGMQRVKAEKNIKGIRYLAKIKKRDKKGIKHYD